MLRHAIQTQSDQLNRPTAATQPPARCSNAVPTKRLDGSTVDFHPKVSTEKIEEQKTSDEDHPVPTVSEDTSSSIGTNTKDAPNEKHLINSATTNQHETIQPSITESTSNPDTEARIKALKDEQTTTRRNIDALKHLYDQLCNAIKHLKTQQQARPQTPHSSSPALQTPANDRHYYIPGQGNLSNDTFLFAIKLLAGGKISASRWDRTRLQVQGGVTGSRGITSPAQSTAHWYGAGSEDESEVVSQDEEGIEDGGVAVGEMCKDHLAIIDGAQVEHVEA
jgi:hypothetical protein